MTHIYSYDWEGIYIDDKLIAEGHQIDYRLWFELGQKNPNITLDHYWVADWYLEEAGELPKNLNDIPKEYLLKENN